MIGALREFKCEECDREVRRDERFHAYMTIDHEIAILCPDCADRKFGSEDGERKPYRGSI